MTGAAACLAQFPDLIAGVGTAGESAEPLGHAVGVRLVDAAAGDLHQALAVLPLHAVCARVTDDDGALTGQLTADDIRGLFV